MANISKCSKYIFHQQKYIQLFKSKPNFTYNPVSFRCILGQTKKKLVFLIDVREYLLLIQITNAFSMSFNHFYNYCLIIFNLKFYPNIT